MAPRMFLGFSWVSRADGEMRYTLRKAWVPTPGHPTSARVIHEGRVLVETHGDDERQVLADILYQISMDLASGD